MLKHIFFVVFLFGSITTFANFESYQISKEINSYKNSGGKFEPVSLFSNYQNDFIEIRFLEQYSLYSIEKQSLNRVLEQKPSAINLPLVLDNQLIDLKLIKANIFSQDFKVTLSDKNFESIKSGDKILGVHYYGIVEREDENSLVSLSVFENEICLLVSTERHGTYLIGKYKTPDSADGIHIGYKLSDMAKYALEELSNRFSCSTIDEGDGGPSKKATSEGGPGIYNERKCINVWLEVNDDIYNYFGNINNTVAFTVGLFTQSASIYKNEGINIKISEMFVWVNNSPYVGSYSSQILNKFQNHRTSFNGDVAHLIDFNRYGGVAAGFSALQKCDDNKAKMCYSGVDPFYFNVPVYSWTVSVFTHEMGHLFGSRHTHACVWNGNNTAIDACAPTAGYPYEGSCSGAPLPNNGGTIMSYCHLIWVGINFYNGFGPQPGTLIRKNISDSKCLNVCPVCPEFYYLYQNGPQGTGYSASRFIESETINNIGAWHVWYTAGEYISLNPGFEATVLDGTFSATIFPCKDEYNVKVQGRQIKPSALQEDSYNALTVTPNPFREQLTVTSTKEILSIHIINPLGSEVKQRYINKAKRAILDVSDLTAGAYFLRIQTIEKEIKIIKVVKL